MLTKMITTKYRVKQIEEEVKRSYMPESIEERYYPQYKKFMTWKNFKTWHKGVKWVCVDDVKFESLQEALQYIEKLIPKKPVKQVEQLPVKEPIYYPVN